MESNFAECGARCACTTCVLMQCYSHDPVTLSGTDIHHITYNKKAKGKIRHIVGVTIPACLMLK